MGRDKKTGKRTPPSRPREVVKAELLGDPNTKKIASSLKMELEKYVELVLDYAYNPDKQPVMTVATDEELKAAGYDAPSGTDVGRWLLGAAKKITDKLASNQVNKTDFRETGPRSVISVPPNPTSTDTAQPAGKTDEKLLKEIKGKTGNKA
ncbi:MAG: hypothetical protein ACJ790_08760 [Myxococcaceae bacterium]